MVSSKLSFFLCFVAIWAFNTVQSASAPAPGVDCTGLVMNLVDCLSFVQNGSTVSKPEGTCCSGLKTVLKTDAQCLCEGFKNSASFGVVLNVTKALSLPAACKVSAPSVASCKLPTATTPSAAPAGAMTPESSPASSSAMAPGATVTETSPTPAPSQGNSSGSSKLALSAASLVLGLVVAAI